MTSSPSMNTGENAPESLRMKFNSSLLLDLIIHLYIWIEVIHLELHSYNRTDPFLQCAFLQLVYQLYCINGYRDLSLMRAPSVVNRQLTECWAALR